MEIKTKGTFLKLVSKLCDVDIEDIKISVRRDNYYDRFNGTTYTEVDLVVNINDKTWKTSDTTLRECYESIYESMENFIDDENRKVKCKNDLHEILTILEKSGIDLSDNDVYNELKITEIQNDFLQ